MINLTKETITTMDYLPLYQVDSNQLSHNEWDKDVTKHFIMLHNIVGMEYMTNELYRRLVLEDYSFMIKVVNRSPYNKDGYTLVDVMLNYCSSKVVSMYMDNSMLVKHERNCLEYSVYAPYNKVS